MNDVLHKILTLPSSEVPCPNVPEYHHGGVVVHMQERDLVVLLAQNEEKLKR